MHRFHRFESFILSLKTKNSENISVQINKILIGPNFAKGSQSVLGTRLICELLRKGIYQSDHELSRFINGFFCTFVTHPSNPSSLYFPPQDLNMIYHYGHHKTSFLDIQSKNTKYPGYKVYMSKLFFLWVNRALKLDESINNLTIGKFSF